MPSHKAITEAAAIRFAAPETGQVDHFDRQYPGLVLRVSCGGRKSWYYLYRIGGKQRRKKLGLFPAELSVAEAHDVWRKVRDLVQRGYDPAQSETGSTNFGDVFEEWMRRDQADNRSVAKVRSRMQKNVLAHWQHRDITKIGRRDVLAVIDAITDRGAVTMARRVHSSLHRLFVWAVGRGIIEINPLAGLERPGEEISRDRVLSDSELVAVWRAAEQLGHPYGPAVQLLILTGARREEIGQLRWSELKDDTIELVGERTKNGEAHTIPLSAPARAIIAELPRLQNCPFLFSHGTRPLNNWAVMKRRLGELDAPWTFHDLRRTAATGLQKLGIPLQTTEAVLNHTGSRKGIVGIYQRHDYAKEKQAALESWGAHVTALVEGRKPGKVVALR
jgi:integrase